MSGLKRFCPNCGNVRGNEPAVVFSIVCVWSKCSQCDYVWRTSVLGTLADYIIGTAGLRRPTRKLEAYVASAAALKPNLHDRDVEAEMDSWAQVENMAPQALAQAAIIADDREEQIGELFDRIDEGVEPRVVVAAAHAAGDAVVDEFCESLAPLNHDVTQPIRAAGSKRKAARPAVMPAAAPVFVAAAASTLVPDADPVEETWERIARQLAGLESKRKSAAVAAVASGLSRTLQGTDEDLSLAASADRMVKNVESVCETFERLERQFAGLERSCSEMLA